MLIYIYIYIQYIFSQSSYSLFANVFFPTVLYDACHQYSSLLANSYGYTFSSYGNNIRT